MKQLVTTPGIHGNQQLRLNAIAGFPGGFALAIAEYAFARMHVPIIDLDHEVEWLTVQNEVNSLNTFIDFFSKLGRSDLSDIRKNDWKRWLKDIRGEANKKRTPERIAQLIKVAYKLWSYGERLSTPLTSIPFGLPIAKVLPDSPTKQKENKTPCIPDHIFSGLMGNALSYTREWAPKIIDTWLEVMQRWKEISKLDKSSSRKDKLIAAYARKILSERPSDWRLTPWTNLEDLLAEVYNLRNAAMLVTLAFSGVRGSELLSICANCCVEDQLPSGAKVWFLNTVQHKHRAGGKADTWVIVEEVVNAVQILEKLTQFIRASTNKDGLLLTNGHAPFSINSDAASFEWEPYTSASLIYQVKAFVEHCSTYLGRDIPQHELQPGHYVDWKFNIRQFRRTLARHIVRRPFGIIAGMLQYKHVSVCTFEGYAGTEPEWNKLIDEEQAQFDVDILGEVALDIAAGEIAGGLGKQLHEEMQMEFEGQAFDASASQIAKWLQSGSRSIHVGKLNLCMFRPEQALCTSRNRDATEPVLNSCEPGNCSNSCVRKEHLPIWQGQLEQTIEFSALTKRNKLQKEVLMREAERIRDVMRMAKDR